MEDIKYGIKPSTAFTERMKKDMGDVKFKEGKEKADYHSKAPMYNKDKNADNEPINEDVKVCASYLDGKGKKMFTEFDYTGVEFVNFVDESYEKLNVGGYGTGWSRDLIKESNDYNYFISKNGLVVKTKKPKLNEGKEFDKIKHLTGYNPKSFLKNKKK
jgi:hypothetical protein